MELSDIAFRSPSPARPTSVAQPALPPPVLPGDRVGVAALSGTIRPERLNAGLAALEGLGFEVVRAQNLLSCCEIFAGTDEERLAGFHELAADPSLKAIFFARGGHGVLRILPDIDWDLLASHPRAYMGYSDLTPFLLHVVERLGLVAFHGPMVAADLARGQTEAEMQSFLDALAGRYPVSMEVEPGPGPTREGPLLGGCLSLLNDTLGTPWANNFSNAILFVEEIDEPFYRFDRMLTHLRLSDNLAGIQGLVSGYLIGVDGADITERHGTERSRARLGELAALAEAPYVWGLEAGHIGPNLTLPLGIHARLEPQHGRLVLG